MCYNSPSIYNRVKSCKKVAWKMKVFEKNFYLLFWALSGWGVLLRSCEFVWDVVRIFMKYQMTTDIRTVTKCYKIGGLFLPLMSDRLYL